MTLNFINVIHQPKRSDKNPLNLSHSMKNLSIYNLAFFLLISFNLSAQQILTAENSDRDSSFDVLPGFINPPKGYGEVPFYWWQGDTLTRERIQWQLDQMADKGISSLQINYSHRDYGGLTYGLSNPSKPPLFSEAWWDLFKWFSAEAQKRDMTVSLSDYTIGVGQGFSMDEAIKAIPDLNGSLLRFSIYDLSGRISRSMPENLLTLNGYRIRKDSSIIVESRKNLIPMLKNGKLACNLGRSPWKVYCVFSEKVLPSYDPMNPQSGKAYVHYFFDKFEQSLPDKGKGRLNFFFSDELNFRLSGNLWDKGFAEEFKKRKGYDIIPDLDALFINADPISPKIKLDYNDVLVSLSEENFFEPVYRWHQERGLTYGCDHGGRGRDVTEFGDYFRTQKWNQGPGSDQPRLSKDIVKAKVASSIAHLYNRPRVWLEGFHSSGWGTSSADVTDAIFANFTAGYNLLSFHGLYYSTMGGWWEWAPPDNHFRMPYWKQIDPLMKCIQRLSYLMSRGYHSCDVAIIYPIEPVVAEMDGEKSVKIAFSTADLLYDKGVDFDFIDFESLARSVVKNGELHVSDERYKVLIVPSMKAIRYNSLKKIEEFRNAGGLVVNIGNLPEATDKGGINDPETAIMVNKIFTGGENLIQCETSDEVPSSIKGKYEAGFNIISSVGERPYMMHRIIGSRDVYVLYNFHEGSKCFFKSKGSAEIWNPWNGEISSLTGFAAKMGNGTEITLPLTSKEIQIIVFDSLNTSSGKAELHKKILKEYDPGNEWEFELKPSLDNRWGDFELPAGNELLGAQIRQMYLTEDKGYSGEKLSPDESWKRVTCGFGAQFLKLGALPELPPVEDMLHMNPADSGEMVSIAGKKYRWEAYSFSWQKGVELDYGHQGYHGLKGEMYDNFIRLGALEDVKMSLKRVPEAIGNYYILLTSVIAPADGNFELLTGDIKPTMLYVNSSKADPGAKSIYLRKGANPVLMVYDKACETYLLFRVPGKPKPHKQPVSMIWYKDYAVLPFDYPVAKNRGGFFVFQSAPGLQSLSFSAYGIVTVWINGLKTEPAVVKTDPDGLIEYFVSNDKKLPEASQVVLRIEYKPGYRGTGAIPQYIRQVCGKGIINAGDWSETDGLRSYSGGAWYRKTITIDEEDLKNKIEIDLGDLVSSAELFVNGKSAGIKVSPPWTFNISEYAAKGKNDIEVLVYNTLANHYTSVPTRYRGDIKSGLIGPVRIRVLEEREKN
jgi:hypothetical protein